MHYKELADGLHHFKETEEGRVKVCEKVRKFAKKYAQEYAKECVVESKADSVKNLMKNISLSLDKAIKALGIKGEEKKTLLKQLQG